MINIIVYYLHLNVNKESTMKRHKIMSSRISGEYEKKIDRDVEYIKKKI